MAPARRVKVIIMSKCMSICFVIFSRPLIGKKWKCYIVKEVIEVDKLYKAKYLLQHKNKTNTYSFETD